MIENSELSVQDKTVYDDLEKGGYDVRIGGAQDQLMDYPEYRNNYADILPVVNRKIEELLRQGEVSFTVQRLENTVIIKDVVTGRTLAEIAKDRLNKTKYSRYDEWGEVK